MSELFKAKCVGDSNDSITIGESSLGSLVVYGTTGRLTSITHLSIEDAHRLADYLVEAGFGGQPADDVPVMDIRYEAINKRIEGETDALNDRLVEITNKLEARIVDLEDDRATVRGNANMLTGSVATLINRLDRLESRINRAAAGLKG